MERSDLALAAMTLQKGYSLVLVRNGAVAATRQGRGIRPLLELVEEKGDFLQGASLADKVVGRAAALLGVYAGLAGVYARVISRPALEAMRTHGLNVCYGLQVNTIMNRQGTGNCPMEDLTATISNPAEAPDKIRKRLLELHQSGSSW